MGKTNKKDSLYLFTYNFSKFIIWIVGKIFFRVSYKGIENIPKEGSVILASNHASFLDPPLLGAGCSRKISFLAKEELFTETSFLFSWWIKTVRAQPVKRGSGDIGSLRATLSILKAGRCMVIFPEGTRTRDGNLQPGKSGTGMIIKKSGATVVPVYIGGTFEACPKSAKIPKIHKVKIVYGEPIPPESFKSLEDGKESYEKITGIIMEKISQLKESIDK